MMLLQRVLVATDLSAQATRAVRRASQLPLARGARIELIHVLPRLMPRASARVTRPLRKKIMEEINGLEERLLQRGIHDAKLIPTFTHGDAYDEILDRARATRAEVIVLGRHGTGGVKTMLLGSTAERVVRGRVAPVLVVTNEARQPYAHVMVGIDPYDPQASAVLLTARRLVGPSTRQLDLVTAYEVALEGWMLAGDVSPAMIAQMRKRAAREAHEALTRHAELLAAEIKVKAHLRPGDPRSVILRVADRRAPDLLVIGSHARRGLARFLLGSVAIEVLRSASVDVAIVPPVKEA